MTEKTTSMIFASVLIILVSQNAYAESTYDEKLSFAGSLEETLGHLWAIEQNLDDKNAELALVHATHPIAEIYDSMKPELKEIDSEFDTEVQKILMDLGEKTGPDVTRQDAQTAIDEAKAIIEKARTIVVGEELSSDIIFQLDLIKGLLLTAETEYEEAVSNGEIHEMAEFQDGSAFVWKSEQIFNKIRVDLPEHESEEIQEFYEELWIAFEQKTDPTNARIFIDGIIHEINEIEGETEISEDLLEYVENIEELLADVKTEYQKGNKDIALSLATKAYLDNFEYLEGPLKETGNVELVSEIEEMLREELRTMIKNDAPQAEVNQQVDAILEKMESVKVAVPEFGSIVTIALATAIIGIIIATSKRTGLSMISRR